jgi:TolB-like protein
MSSFLKSKNLYRTLAVYLGSSWVLIEAGNYFINRYSYPDYYIEVLIVLLAFGLLSFVFNEWIATWKEIGKQNTGSLSVWPHFINVMIAITVAYYVWDNARLNYMKFQNNNPELVSIAVLPFENVGPDSTYYWMGDAICGELINNLDKVGSIDVKSKSASFYFKDKDYNPVQIAGLLGVNSMLDGSIMVLDSNYRITVSLINPLSGSQIWNETFEGRLDNIFDLQTEIALTITDKINAEVSQDEKKEIQKKLTENNEAYELFMKGKYHYNLITPVDNYRAHGYFKSAIALDDNFVMAHAYLGMTYQMYGGIWLGLSPDSAYHMVDKIVNKIFTLDEGNPMGLFLKSNVVFFYDRDYNKGCEIATKAYNYR